MIMQRRNYDKDDVRFWVKYRFKTGQGIDFLPQGAADRIAGEDADYRPRDCSSRSNGTITPAGR
jgi:catalase